MVAASEYTSARTSPVGFSASSSGGDHGIDMPTAAPELNPVVSAIPKSVSAGQPKSVTSTLAGLMSRCRMPAWCAVSTAHASRTPMRSTSATLIRSVRYRRPRPACAQYSITR